MGIVAVTGCSGYLGTQLLGFFEKDQEIEKVVGLDRVEPREKFSKLDFYRVDINDPLENIFIKNRVESAVHLVFIVDPMHDKKRMREINIEGSKNFLRACQIARVKKIVVASSATAYGALWDNPPFFKEGAKLRGDLAGESAYQYAKEKAELEKLCAEFAKANPETEVVVVRPSIFIGPHVNNFISRYMTRPVVFILKGSDPGLQFTHEEDVARAFYLLVKKGKAGVYNVGADGTVRIREVIKRLKRKSLAFPPWLLYPLNNIFWQLRAHFLTENPSSLLDFIRYPWVANSDKIKNELGFEFKYTTQQAFEEFARAWEEKN